jgi:hypothetical protein
MSAQAARRGGKRHVRACRANDSRLAAFVDAMESAPNSDAMAAYMTSTASQLARVIKNHGGRQLEIQLQDGTTVKARVSGTLATRGRSSTKGHIEYVMSTNDVILFSGGFAAAKVPRGLYKHLERLFTDNRVAIPKGFFAIGEAKPDGEADDDGWDWDTSLSGSTSAVELARLRSYVAAGEAAVAAGGAGKADDSDDDLDIDAV